MTNTSNMIIGQRRPFIKFYQSNDGKRFRLLGLEQRDQTTWVRYRSLDTLNDYICLQEAFESRFHPMFDF
jgi:hypothetical protein